MCPCLEFAVSSIEIYHIVEFLVNLYGVISVLISETHVCSDSYIMRTTSFAHDGYYLLDLCKLRERSI